MHGTLSMYRYVGEIIGILHIRHVHSQTVLNTWRESCSGWWFTTPDNSIVWSSYVYASTCTVSQTVYSHRKCTLRIIGYSISSLTSFSFCFIFFNIDMSPISIPSADSALSPDVPVWYEVVRIKGCSSPLSSGWRAAARIWLVIPSSNLLFCRYEVGLANNSCMTSYCTCGAAQLVPGCTVLGGTVAASCGC